VRTKNDTFQLKSVFDHDADPVMVNALRDSVIDDLLFLHEKYPHFSRVGAADLHPADYEQMRRKYQNLLHYGVFSLPAKRAAVNELIWKWTEATGKYVGCQFWSVGAHLLFDSAVRECGGWPITAKTARRIEQTLSEWSRAVECRLTHEHVYPIKDMKRWLGARTNPTREDFRIHLERQCVSCVLLESEHDRSEGNDANPWLRYKKAGIRLVSNPAWPDAQRAWIMEADLI
jgi:hypothetical protein